MEKDYIKDTSDCYLVTVTKLIFHTVPVRAKNKEDAIEMVDHLLSEMSDDEITDKFYCDSDWQYDIDTFEKAGYICSEENLINNELKNGI